MTFPHEGIKIWWEGGEWANFWLVGETLPITPVGKTLYIYIILNYIYYIYYYIKHNTYIYYIYYILYIILNINIYIYIYIIKYILYRYIYKRTLSTGFYILWKSSVYITYNICQSGPLLPDLSTLCVTDIYGYIFTCLFSVRNTINLLSHEQVCQVCKRQYVEN